MTTTSTIATVTSPRSVERVLAGTPTSDGAGVKLTRGGRYRNTPADSQVPYLRTVLAFLGMTDVHFVYAEGLAMGPDAERSGLAAANEQIEAVV